MKELTKEGNKLVEVTTDTIITRVEYDLDRLKEQRVEQQWILDELDAKIAECESRGIKTKDEVSIFSEQGV